MNERDARMATKDSDTDPSTPAARVAMKPSAPAPTLPITPAKILVVAPAAQAGASKGTGTDPGVAPPPTGNFHESDTDPDPRVPRISAGFSAPPTPVAVPVPHAARRQSAPPKPAAKPSPLPPKPSAPPAKAGAGKNDSIDALLDGIAGPQPEKTKKTPQSRGEAAAAYQVEHRVLPGQPTPPPQPSVIVDRPKLPPTVKIERAKIEAAAAAHRAAMAAHGPGSERPVTRAGEATVVTPRKLGPRIVVALFSAVLVVFAIFVAIRIWAVGVKMEAVKVDPTASALVKGPIPQFGAKPAPSASASATATAEPTATAVPTNTAPTATATATAPVTTAPAPATTSAAPRPAVPDLKTDFKH